MGLYSLASSWEPVLIFLGGFSHSAHLPLVYHFQSTPWLILNDSLATGVAIVHHLFNRPPGGESIHLAGSGKAVRWHNPRTAQNNSTTQGLETCFRLTITRIVGD